MVNPYESPTTGPEPPPPGLYRARFKRACINSLLLAVMSYTLSQAMEHAMPEEPNDTYIVIRALVALITVTSMTTMGLFGIGWALSPRAAR